jgi:hypothetical protein
MDAEQRSLVTVTKIMSKIMSRIRASKEFLVIVLALGLTNSIVEGLRYQDDYLLNKDIIGLLALFVFIIYASRFYLNNWIYLSESYDKEELMEKCGITDLRGILVNARLDLFASMFTGIVVLIISMMLDKRRFLILLSFLIAHYVVDFYVLLRNILRRTAEHGVDTTYFKRARAWLINHLGFSIVFAFLIPVLYFIPENRTVQLLGLAFWFFNCVAAIGITLYYKEPTNDAGDTPAETAVGGGITWLTLDFGAQTRLSELQRSVGVRADGGIFLNADITGHACDTAVRLAEVRAATVIRRDGAVFLLASWLLEQFPDHLAAVISATLNRMPVS